MRRLSTLVIVLSAACAPERSVESSRAASTPTMTDSAGVRIVSHGQLADVGPGPGITEVLRVGSVEGASENLFSDLAGGFILPDGGVVLADRDSREVRRFGPTGAYLGKHGREGEGPGEYRFIRGMDRCRPEGFTVFDIGYEMSMYDERGEFVEEVQPRLEGGSTPYHMACHPSGLMAAINWDPAGPQVGFHTATGRLRIVTTGGTEVVDMGERIGSERVGVVGGSSPHPAGRSTRFGFTAEDLIVADGSLFGFERWALDGALHEIVRLEAEPASVDSLIAAYEESALSETTSDAGRAFVREQVEAMRGLPRAALVSDLFVSDEVILLREPNIAGRGRWFAFRADGTPEGYVPLPAGTKLLDARDGHLLVQEVGPLDVPVAVLYRVEWTSAP